MKLEVFATAALLTISIAACVPAIILTEQTLIPNARHATVPSLKMLSLVTFSDSLLPKQDWQLSLALEK